MYWVAASPATRAREGQSTVGLYNIIRQLEQLLAVNVNKTGTALQSVDRKCIMKVKMHST